jgi:hypothetical protein
LVLLGLFLVSYMLASRFEKAEQNPLREFTGPHTIMSWIAFPALAALSAWQYGAGSTLAKFLPIFLPAMILPALYGYYSKRPHLLKRWLAAGAALAVIYGLLQFAFGHYQTAVPGLTVNYTDYIAGNVFEQKHNVTPYGLKLVGAYQNGNLFGFALIGITICSLGHSFIYNSRLRIWLLLLSAGGAVCLVLTLSRSAIIGLLCGLAVFAVLYAKVVKYAGVAGAAAAIIALQAGVAERFSTFDATGAGRTLQYSNFFDASRSMRPLDLVGFIFSGRGMGLPEVPTYTIQRGEIQTVESGIVDLLIYAGAIGLLVYIMPVLYGGIKVMWMRKIGNTNKCSYVGAAAAFASLAGMWVQMAMDQLLNLPPTGFLYWIMCGLLLVELRGAIQGGDDHVRIA